MIVLLINVIVWLLSILMIQNAKVVSHVLDVPLENIVLIVLILIHYKTISVYAYPINSKIVLMSVRIVLPPVVNVKIMLVNVQDA